MKKRKNRSLFPVLLCLALYGGTCHGQTYIETEVDDGDSNVFVGQIVVIQNQNQLDLLGIDNANPRNAEITNNSLVLNQIGALNVANISTVTNASEILIKQQGNNNQTTLDYEANTAVANLQQLGNNNIIIDDVTAPTEDISLDLLQDGDGFYFERFGTNSLTRSLKLTQTGASPALIIRSFN